MRTVIIGRVHLDSSRVFIHFMEKELNKLIVPVELVTVNLIRLLLGIFLSVKKLPKMLS